MTKAEMILTNAKVLTMDSARPRAEAVALAGGRILAVGTNAEVAELAGPGCKVMECGGRTLLPGFVESHLHLVIGGSELSKLQLGGLTGAEALGQAFRAFAAANPEAPLLLAVGADYGLLGHDTTRADLDAVIADRPIAMISADHHTAWANTAALEQAGLLHGAEMPAGHEVVMGDDGLATGELLEFQAFAPVLKLGGEQHLQLGISTGGEPDPWPDAAQRALDKDKVVAGLAHATRYGITSMVNMDGNLYTCVLLAELRDEGRLTARVKVPFHFKPQMDLSELERAEEMRARYDDEWVSSGFVKMFMDGVVDSRTAFMLNDYAGQPGHRGTGLFEQQQFAEVATEIDRRGLQIAVHAIGDGAVRRTLDGYAAARAANGARDSRHRIEHIELIDRADVPRLAALGVVASLQPAHVPGAMDFPLHPTTEVIGADRLPDSFLTRTLAETGAPVAFASDWPVTDVAVMRNIQAALTRQPFAGAQDERLDLMAVLHAYTAGGAWAAHCDHLTGRLIPGLAGDLVLLDGDIETTEPEAIGAMGIALTVCGGQITHQKAG